MIQYLFLQGILLNSGDIGSYCLGHSLTLSVYISLCFFCCIVISEFLLDNDTKSNTKASSHNMYSYYKPYQLELVLVTHSCVSLFSLCFILFLARVLSFLFIIAPTKSLKSFMVQYILLQAILANFVIVNLVCICLSLSLSFWLHD